MVTYELQRAVYAENVAFVVLSLANTIGEEHHQITGLQRYLYTGTAIPLRKQAEGDTGG
jgi:hypothetical protein